MLPPPTWSMPSDPGGHPHVRLFRNAKRRRATECSRIRHRQSVYDARAWESIGDTRCCCGHSSSPVAARCWSPLAQGRRPLRWSRKAYLPEGPGRDVTVALCGKCHGAETVASVRHTPEGWREVIARMVAAGAQGSEQELDTVAQYLSTHFPAEAQKPLDLNTAPRSRSRERGRFAAQGGGRPDRTSREERPMQEARRPQDGRGARLQEDRGAKGAARLPVTTGVRNGGRSILRCATDARVIVSWNGRASSLLKRPNTRTYRMRTPRLFLAAAVPSLRSRAVAATDILMEGVDTARTGWVKRREGLHARQRRPRRSCCGAFN